MTARQAGILCGCLVLSATAASARGQDEKRDATVREVLALQHDVEVLHVAISPDGKRILACCEAFYVTQAHAKVWDADTGKLLHTLKMNKGGVNIANFSPDGKRIVAVCWAWADSRNLIKVWNAETGKTIGEDRYLDHPISVNLPIISPDGKRIVSFMHTSTPHEIGMLKLWDAGTGKNLRAVNGHTAWVNGLAVSADGKRLASGSADKTLKLWDMETFKEVRTLKGHTGSVGSVAFSPDGKRLVSSGAVTDYRDDAKVWDIDAGKVVFDLDMKGIDVSIRSVAYSPDGKLVAAGENNGAMKIWDAATGKDVVVFKPYKNAVRSIAFHPDGKRIVTGADDKSVKVWELKR